MYFTGTLTVFNPGIHSDTSVGCWYWCISNYSYLLINSFIFGRGAVLHLHSERTGAKCDFVATSERGE